MMLLFILAIVFMVSLIVSLPSWPLRTNCGYYLIIGISVVIPIILMLAFTGNLRAR
jgi:hypothetical protein